MTFDPNSSTDDEQNQDVLNYITELAYQGVKLSKTQIWVLIKCYERTRTISSMARERGLTYQGMHSAVAQLCEKRLLEEVTQLSGEGLFRCRFDISETADYSYKVKYKGQTLDMETLIGYLENAANIQRLPHYVALMLTYLYNRSVKKEKEKQTPGPTPVEVRSFLMQLVSELEDFTILLRQLADMKLYEANVKIHDMMGDMNTHANTQELINYLDGDFISAWENKNISQKGLIGAKKPKEYSEDMYKAWTP
jgi:hypothetical protein